MHKIFYQVLQKNKNHWSGEHIWAQSAYNKCSHNTSKRAYK